MIYASYEDSMSRSIQTYCRFVSSPTPSVSTRETFYTSSMVRSSGSTVPEAICTSRHLLNHKRNNPVFSKRYIKCLNLRKRDTTTVAYRSSFYGSIHFHTAIKTAQQALHHDRRIEVYTLLMLEPSGRSTKQWMELLSRGGSFG